MKQRCIIEIWLVHTGTTGFSLSYMFHGDDLEGRNVLVDHLLMYERNH